MKNSDGSNYNLNRPNPIMKTQEIWDKKEKVILHNEVGKIFIFSADGNPVTQEQIEPKEQVLEIATEPVIVEKLENPAVSESQDKSQIWCLPATYKTYKDSLYNEEHRKIIYENKFLFEAIITDQDDFSMTLWTNKLIKEGSVLFPRTHDKRWWRVSKVTESDDGYIVSSMPSDYQPKFSD